MSKRIMSEWGEVKRNIYLSATFPLYTALNPRTNRQTPYSLLANIFLMCSLE